MRSYLDFEKPVAEFEAKVEELRALQSSGNGAADIAEDIGRLETKAAQALRDLYAELTPWQKTQVARHPQRPHCLDYIATLITEFVPFAGDRKFSEDHAVVGGFGRFRGESICVIGHEKGSTTESRLKHNFGMARPEGYRKAVRLMEMADRFGIPVLALVDTAGAYPGIDAEERGQAEAIARSTERCLTLGTPSIATITGEGGSGGAIALGHPLGGSGARIMTTMLYHMRDNGIRYGLQTICEGGGTANVTIIERSIDRMRQYGQHSPDSVPVLVVTHKTTPEAIDHAMQALPRTGVVEGDPVEQSAADPSGSTASVVDGRCRSVRLSASGRTQRRKGVRPGAMSPPPSHEGTRAPPKVFHAYRERGAEASSDTSERRWIVADDGSSGHFSHGAIGLPCQRVCAGTTSPRMTSEAGPTVAESPRPDAGSATQCGPSVAPASITTVSIRMIRSWNRCVCTTQPRLTVDPSPSVTRSGSGSQ